MNTVSPPKLDALLEQIDTFLKKASSALSDSKTGSDRFTSMLVELKPICDDLGLLELHLRDVSSDPLSPRAQVSAARAHILEAEEEEKRLQTIQGHLQIAKDKAVRREQEEARIQAYDTAVRNRQAVVERILKEAWAHIDALHSIFHDICASNHEIELVNKNLPKDSEKLIMAEGVARGFKDTELGTPLSRQTARLIQMYLPDANNREGFIWPPMSPNEQDNRRVHGLLDEERVQGAWKNSQ